MKNRFIVLLLFINLASCEVFRPPSRSTDNLSATSDNPSGGGKSAPVFIQNISTQTADRLVRTTESNTYNSPSANNAVPHPVGADDYNQLRYKYSILTDVPVEDLSNIRLLIFMEQWYGVRYQYGGTNRNGIDCSAFSSLLLSSVYNENQLPRMSADQYKITRRIAKKDLQEGDLVFFHTFGKGHKVTHVGVYLYNSRFVHASIAGVQISNLGEGYYLSHYVGAGRVAD